MGSNFGEEVPDGWALATAYFVNLARVAVTMLGELNRRLAHVGVPS